MAFGIYCNSGTRNYSKTWTLKFGFNYIIISNIAEHMGGCITGFMTFRAYQLISLSADQLLTISSPREYFFIKSIIKMPLVWSISC